jgi:hypothetical protein
MEIKPIPSCKSGELSYADLFQDAQNLKHQDIPQCFHEIADGITRQIEINSLSPESNHTSWKEELQKMIQEMQHLIILYTMLQTRVKFPLMQYETTRFSHLDYYLLKDLCHDLQHLFHTLQLYRATLDIKTTTIHFDTLHEQYLELQSLKTKYDGRVAHQIAQPTTHKIAA